MRKLTKIAVAVSGALLLSYGAVAKADITPFTPAAYAESVLNVSNFQITLGDGGSLLPLLGDTILNLEANVQGNVSANLNGAPSNNAASINPLASPAQTFDISASQGAGYVPFTSYGVGTLAPSTFAGAAAQHSGNALQLNGAPTTTANTQAQVNIYQSSSVGSADSRQNLATTFELDIVDRALTFLVSFDAEAYARIALGQPDVIAQIDRNWGLDVRDTTDPLTSVLLLSWEPDGVVDSAGLGGICFGLGACTEVADAFTLNLEGSTLNTLDTERTDPLGRFALALTLGPGTYQISINHDTSADAQARVPEPGSLALLGAGLMGLAALRRKFKKA